MKKLCFPSLHVPEPQSNWLISGAMITLIPVAPGSDPESDMEAICAKTSLPAENVSKGILDSELKPYSLFRSMLPKKN